jgi:hypothetical protein
VLREEEDLDMKRIVVLILPVLVLFLLWYFFVNIAQARRDARYRELLASYQHELLPGMKRAAVRSYLDSKSVQYQPSYGASSGAWSYEIKIGEEPAYSLVCESWTVYVTFDFSTSAKDASEPLQGDTLKAIRIRKLGTCL